MSVNKPRILVIGGNGFIGRHIIQRGVDLAWCVTGLSLSEPTGVDRIEGVRYLTANIADAIQLSEVLTDVSFEYVVNCGGYVDHTLFSKGGSTVLNAHFGGTQNLVQLLRRDCLKSYVNIGSSDEYGGVPAPQIETYRESPISPYSLGKVASTHFLEMLYLTERFPSTTLRLFLTYGPGQGMQRFLPQIIKGCIEDRSFPVSAGQQLRDFCFVQDVVDAVFAVFSRPATHGETINIGSGVGMSIRQMIDEVRMLVGGGDPRFGEITYRAGENMALYADVSKAKLLLGWSSKVSLISGLQQTIQWVRSVR